MSNFVPNLKTGRKILAKQNNFGGGESLEPPGFILGGSRQGKSAPPPGVSLKGPDELDSAHSMCHDGREERARSRNHGYGGWSFTKKISDLVLGSICWRGGGFTVMVRKAKPSFPVGRGTKSLLAHAALHRLRRCCQRVPTLEKWETRRRTILADVEKGGNLLMCGNMEQDLVLCCQALGIVTVD